MRRVSFIAAAATWVAASTLAGCESGEPTTPPAPADTGPTADAVAAFDAGSADAVVASVDSGVDAGVSDASPSDAGGTDAAAPDAACPLGAPCNPIPVAAFPFTDHRDTSQAPSDVVDRYACAPGTDESGGEFFYRIDVASPGLLTARVDDVGGDDIDVDVHLLDSLTTDGTSCLQRNDLVVRRVAEARTYYLVADTWVNGAGRPFPGPYELTVELDPLPAGPCAMQPLELKMYWDSCPEGTSYDCRSRPDPGGGPERRYLSTPAFGPVVHEAHLVTVDDGFGASWPTSGRDGLDGHYQRSQVVTGYAMQRRTDWAPAG